MYYIVFAILLYGCFLEMFMRRKFTFGFYLAYAMMTFMVMFRYDQLTDYSGYEYLYSNWDMPEWRDPLFRIISNAVKDAGFDFKAYVMIVGAATMGMSLPFFYKICDKSCTALFVFYTYAFLILPMSGMRQGICLAMLLLAFTFLVRGKRLLFFLIVAIGSFIHLSMISTIPIGLFYKKDWYNKDWMKWVVLGMAVFALLSPDLSQYTAFLNDRSFEASDGNRSFQVVLRVIIIAPLVFVKPLYGTPGYYAKAICIMGYCLFCLLVFNEQASSRNEYYFRVFLGLFIWHLIFVMKRVYLKNAILGVFLAIHVFMFFKNINSFITQGSYSTENVNMFNFPYISIFD